MENKTRINIPTINADDVIEKAALARVKDLDTLINNLIDNMSKASSGKNLTKYWKTQEALIEDVVQSCKNFNKVSNATNASNLLKATNALKAVHGIDLSDIIPDFGNFEKSLQSARNMIGNLDSAFDVSSFKNAFEVFENLKRQGLDVREIFHNLEAGSGAAQLFDDLNNANNTINKLTIKIKELQDKLDDSESGNGIKAIREECEDLRSEIMSIRQEAENTFSAFLTSNNIDADYYKYDEFFDKIRDGSLTAQEAIAEFKRDYAYLLDGNASFDTTQLQDFSKRLDGVSTKITEVSNKLDDITLKGVKVNDGDASGSLEELANVVREIENTTESTNTSAIYESLSKILTIIKEIGQVDTDNLYHLSETIRQLSKLDDLKINKSSLDNLADCIERICKIDKSSVLSNLSLVDFKNFNDLHISKASLNNLAEYLPRIANINVEKLIELTKVDFSNLNNFKIDKETLNNLKQFANSLSGTLHSNGVNNVNVDKSNISSGNSEVENIKKQQQYYKDIANELVGIQDRHEGTHLIINEIGKSESEVISTIIQENKEIAAGNELWKERQFYIDEYGKVTASYRGDKNEIGIGNAGNISIGNPVKETHIHPYNENGAGSYSIGDVYNMHLAFLQGIRQFELRWRDEVLSIDLTNIDPKSLLSMADSYEDFCAGVQKVMYDVYQIDQDFVFNRGQNLKNSYLANLIQDRGGSAKLYTQNFDGTKTQKDFLDISNAEQALISTTGLYAIKLSELNEESEEYQRTAQYILNNRKDLAEYYQKMGLITSPDIDNDSLKSQINLINEFTNAFNQYISAYEDYYGRMSPDGDGFGLSQSEKTLSELEKLYPELKEVRSNGYVNYPDSELYDKALKKYLNRQEQLQNGLKQTKEQAEQTSKSVQNVSNSPIEDVIQGETEKSGKDAVSSATEKAVQAKNEFASANKGVQSSIDGSKSPLQLEAELMDQIAKSAHEAAEAKKEFVEANKQVKSGAESSSTSLDGEDKKIENVGDSAEETKKKTEGFDEREADNQKLEQQKRIYQELIDTINRYATVAKRIASKSAYSTDEEDLARLQARIEELRNEPLLSEEQLDKSQRKLDEIETTVEDIQKRVVNTTLDNLQGDIDKYYKNYDKYSIKPKDVDRNPQYTKDLEEYKSTIDKLAAEKERLAGLNLEFITEDDLKNVRRIESDLAKIENRIKGYSAAEKGSDLQSRLKQIDKINKYLEDNTRISQEAKYKLRELLQTLENDGAAANVKKINEEFIRITNNELAAGRAGKSFMDVLKDKKFYSFAGQIASYFSFYDIINVIRRGAQEVRELNKALTEMRKVSDESLLSLKEYQNLSFDMGDEVGTTGKQIMESTADWLRLGESMKEASKSASTSNILLNVSEFESIDEATESLVSMSQAYKDLDKIEIVDVLNNLGNNYAISTDGLATALKDSASALKTAQNDYYEAAALATAANTVVQDPSKVGAGKFMPEYIVICRYFIYQKVAISVKSQGWSRPREGYNIC